MDYFLQIYVTLCYIIMTVFATSVFVSQEGLTRMDLTMLLMAPFSAPMMIATKITSLFGDPDDMVL